MVWRMGVGSEIFVAAGDFIQVPTILAYMHWESLSGESSIVGKYRIRAFFGGGRELDGLELEG